jgi:hypothetical protein
MRNAWHAKVFNVGKAPQTDRKNSKTAWQKPELVRLGKLVDVAGPNCVGNDGAQVLVKNVGPGCS